MRRLILLLVLVAACGGAVEPTTTDAPTAADPPATTEAPPPADTTTTTVASSPGDLYGTVDRSATEGASLEVASSDELGEFLTGPEGFTLYAFLNDDQGESTCYDTCAGTWPPVIDSPDAGDGVDPALLGTTTRDDGAEQVTYNGWPLYYYAGDVNPGDTTGQGFSGIWYVIDPEGNPVEG